jgi:hypothetical protein
MDYSVNSARGWIAPLTGSTELMNPFDFYEFDLVFNIPEETATGTVDTVVAVLTIGDTFADTSISTITCIGEEQGTHVSRTVHQIIQNFSLAQNYPNPFNPKTTIRFAVKEKCRVVLKIYDILGRESATLIDQVRESGYHQVTFNAAGLPSGVYFYRIQMNGFTDVKKMLLME